MGFTKDKMTAAVKSFQIPVATTPKEQLVQDMVKVEQAVKISLPLPPLPGPVFLTTETISIYGRSKAEVENKRQHILEIAKL